MSICDWSAESHALGQLSTRQLTSPFPQEKKRVVSSLVVMLLAKAYL